MVLKTREKLIEVARYLFVHKGVENTTMNDIANASDKGRRTIYTYFKSKREIYNAVIETESDKLVIRLREITESDMPTDSKLREFLRTRIFTFVSITEPFSTVRSIFSREYKRMERIRKLAYEKESVLLAQILDEGISNGLFIPQRCDLLKQFLLKLLQGMDLTNFGDNNRESLEITTTPIIEFIIESITNNNS